VAPKQQQSREPDAATEAVNEAKVAAQPTPPEESSLAGKLEEIPASATDPALLAVLTQLAETNRQLAEMQLKVAEREDAPRTSAVLSGDPDELMRQMQGAVSAGPAPEGDDVLPEPVTFRSKGVNFNVIRKARHRVTHANGDVEISEGIHYNFAPTGTFTTQDRRVVEFLNRLPSFNLEFWQVGAEPGAVPPAEATIASIMRAVRDLDVDRVDEIAREEQAGHQREQVLLAIENARGLLREGAEVA
jgi:hypothetical protein